MVMVGEFVKIEFVDGASDTLDGAELSFLHLQGFDGDTLDEAWADVERCAYLGNAQAWQMLRIPLPPPRRRLRRVSPLHNAAAADRGREMWGDGAPDTANAYDVEVSEP